MLCILKSHARSCFITLSFLLITLVTAAQSGLGQTPTISMTVTGQSQSSGQLVLALSCTNSGSLQASSISLTSVVTRVLAGGGTLSVSSPALPFALGALSPASSEPLQIAFNLKGTVTRFTLVENGTIQDASGNTSQFSLSQLVTVVAAAPVATLNISPTSLSFGTANLGTGTGAVPQTVMVSNTGSTSVSLQTPTIAGAASPDFRLQSTTCAGSLTPGASCTATVVFVPQGVGPRAGILSFVDSAAGSPQTVALNGTSIDGPSSITLNPTSINFGSAYPGQTSGNQTVNVTNTGFVAVTSIALAGANPADFLVLGNSCNAGSYLAPNQGCSIQLQFKPTVSGQRTASLLFTDNDGVQSVGLTGTALTPTLTPTSNSVNFGSSYLTVATNPQYVTVNNTGFVNLTSVSVAGTNASEFTVLGGSCPIGSYLAPNQGCDVVLQFKPVAAGVRTAVLTFVDSASGSPQGVSLVGTGVASSMTITPAVLSFGTESVGATTGVQHVEVANSGPVNLTSVTITGTNASDFILEGGSCPVGSYLPQGLGCEEVIAFQPTGAGPRTAVLTFVDNATGSPQSITLQGTGSGAVSQLSPVTLQFSADSETTATKYTYLTNATAGQNSADTLVVRTSALSGADAADFSVDTTQCTAASNTALLPGDYCALGIVFTPSRTGNEQATLTITDSSKSVPQLVQLTGTSAAMPASHTREAIPLVAAQTPAPLLLNASTNLIDFGSVTAGATASATISLQYSGPAGSIMITPQIVGPNVADLSINAASCSLLTAVPCTLNVVYSPAIAGKLSASLIIDGGATDTTLSIPLTANVLSAAGVTFSRTNLDFGMQTIGSQNTQAITVSNVTNSDIHFAAPLFTGDNASDFELAYTDCATLPARGACVIRIAFSPGAVGDRSSTLQINSDNPTSATQSITLTGSGQSATNLLSSSTAALDFGTIPVGSTTPQQLVQITNTGTTAINLNNLAISGTDASDFEVTSSTNCPASLGPASACTVFVSFTPSAAGAHSATLVVTNTSAANGLLVTLSGQAN